MKEISNDEVLHKKSINKASKGYKLIQSQAIHMKIQRQDRMSSSLLPHDTRHKQLNTHTHTHTQKHTASWSSGKGAEFAL